jgi:preprotein translocase subunit SecA
MIDYDPFASEPYILRNYTSFEEYNKDYPHKSLSHGHYESIRTEPKIGRNDRCPCGSGKKYKHCCVNKS